MMTHGLSIFSESIKCVWPIMLRVRLSPSPSVLQTAVLFFMGCTVTAGDSGVDAVEAPNGIVCSGATAATDPLCTEQYQNNAVAALKVTPPQTNAFQTRIAR